MSKIDKMENLDTIDNLDIIDKCYTQNRELSWILFNERVLDEADDNTVPLLERLKFVSIFINNLDEFFMIRVGSLFDLSIMLGDKRDNKTGMTPKEQLNEIYSTVKPLYEKKIKVYDNIKKELEVYGVYLLDDFDELTSKEAKVIKNYYKTNIKPIISPQIVGSHHPFPHIPNKAIYIALLLKHKNNITLGLLPIPSALPQIVYLPGNETRFIPIEKIILEFVDDIFDNYEIIEKNCICITRNADIHSDDEDYEIEDFKNQMKKLLQKRKKLGVVRMEAIDSMSQRFSSIFTNKFHIQDHQIFTVKTSLKMDYVFELIDKLTIIQKKQLLYPEFIPSTNDSINLSQSIIKQIKLHDALICYPYESMDIFLQLIKESAFDKNVISIKISIYRLAKKAKLIDYLCMAAENGIDVVVVMELRARFDEQNNIDWSEKLEDAGCKVIYGFDKYKVHSKVCLITLKSKNEIQYITQIGTGNYNEKTAELYTDLSLITSNREIGIDATEFFKNLLIENIGSDYKSLLVAPHKLKIPLLQMMDEEIAKGKKGFIFIKINSLTDIDFIHKLVEASKAGVRVRLIVRGICCLLPNIPHVTENITAISVVGRFLEHSRIYCFGTGEEQKIYISSADLMTRNTERRIEVACPVKDKVLKQKINIILDSIWHDNVKARIISENGAYLKKEDNSYAIDSQSYCMDLFSKKKPFNKLERNIWKKSSKFIKLLKKYIK